MRTHPHRRRPPVLVAGAVPLVAALLATGCDAPSTATTAAEEEAFSGVRFTLGPRSGIELSGASREAVTSAGSYPVTNGRAHPVTRPADKLLVVLRQWPQSERASRGTARRMSPPDEPAIETGFLVDTVDWTSAELDGHSLQWLRRDTIRIDTTNATVGDRTRLTLSGPHGGGPGQGETPSDNRACEGVDPSVNRHAVVPEVQPGASVASALARLREQCLDVQYASLPGGRPGTVRSIAVPVAGQPNAAAVEPGDTVLTDPSRPVTVTVNR